MPRDGLGWELSTDGVLRAINAAIRGGDAMVVADGFGGTRPRLSPPTRRLPGCARCVVESVPGRSLQRDCLWGTDNLYGEWCLFGPAGYPRSRVAEPARFGGQIG